MIPILYKADTTDLTTYGIGTLTETTSCIVTEERNGKYECTIKYPTNGFLYNEIKKDRIIKAKPNDTSNPQAFRIYRITTPMNGVITIYAQHISYDLSNIAVAPFSFTSGLPQQVMDYIKTNSITTNNFTFSTDYSSPKDFTISKPQSIRACLGGSSGSILSEWGGEYEWDNYRVIHHQKRGNNNGVTIEYGKNLTKLEQDSDISEVYTDLLPFAVSKDDEGVEQIITLPEQLMPIKTSLERRKTLIKDFTDTFGYDETITVDKLRDKAVKYKENNPLGTESPTLKISFEQLWKQPEYAAVLERVSLCDTVTVKYKTLGITSKMKVVSTSYDSLSEKYNSMTLGSSKANLSDNLKTLDDEVNEAKKQVERFPKLLTSAISSATKLITGQSGGYVVIHQNEGGEPYELLILDTEKIEDAVNVWRWNMGGLGFSSHGYSGPYDTAITNDGAIVADFITSGSLVANIIKAGIISSLDGSSYWNIETGEVVLRAYATTESVDEATTRIEDIENQKMYRLVISSSNGNIFKNGKISTILSATVYSWDTDITDTLDSNQFIWTRVSSNSESDKKWNDAHYGGTKTITITNDDVQVRATFYCDLIDTTTRQSLLGN